MELESRLAQTESMLANQGPDRQSTSMDLDLDRAEAQTLSHFWRAVVTNLVDLYKSLGGGWDLRISQDPLDLITEQTRQEMLERTTYWEKTFKTK